MIFEEYAFFPIRIVIYLLHLLSILCSKMVSFRNALCFWRSKLLSVGKKIVLSLINFLSLRMTQGIARNSANKLKR